MKTTNVNNCIVSLIFCFVHSVACSLFHLFSGWFVRYLVVCTTYFFFLQLKYLNNIHFWHKEHWMYILLAVVAIVVMVCVLENGNVMIFGSSEGQTEKKRRHLNKWDSKMSKQNVGLHHLVGFWKEKQKQNKNKN